MTKPVYECLEKRVTVSLPAAPACLALQDEYVTGDDIDAVEYLVDPVGALTVTITKHASSEALQKEPRLLRPVVRQVRRTYAPGEWTHVEEEERWSYHEPPRQIACLRCSQAANGHTITHDEGSCPYEQPSHRE